MCQVWRLTSATVGAGDSGHQWTEGATSPGEPVNRSAQECLIPSCSSHFPQYEGGGGTDAQVYPQTGPWLEGVTVFWELTSGDMRC